MTTSTTLDTPPAPDAASPWAIALRDDSTVAISREGALVHVLPSLGHILLFRELLGEVREALVALGDEGCDR